MTQPDTRPVARCEDCSKAYRVPSPDRAYACKACGGIVRVVDVKGPAGDHGSEGLVLCKDCQTLNPLGAESCSGCEADLEGSAVVEDEEEAADLIDEAKQAFRRGSRWSKWIAWTYQLGALVYAGAALAAVFALAEPEVPLEGGIVVVVLTVSMSVLMGTAALHLLFQPFLWVLAVAVLASAIAVLHAVGPNPFGVALLGSTAWAALSWMLLFPVNRLQRWIARHKDLYILHHASLRTKQSVRERSPAERHERLLRAMRRADRRAWKVSATMAAALVVACAFGIQVVLANARPQPLGPTLVEFETTWNAGSADAIEPLFDARVREVEGAWFRSLTTGHGWRAALPALPEGVRREGKGEVSVDYVLAGLDLTARFVVKDREWRLAKIELPCPPVEPAIERFRVAWDAGDIEAMADLHAPESRAEVLAKLEESRTRRGWDEFPAVLGTEVTEDGERRATAVMSLENKRKVTTNWFFRDDGEWGVFGLKMPPIPFDRGGSEPPTSEERANFQRAVAGPESRRGVHLVATDDGGYAVTGVVDRADSRGEDVSLVRVDAGGRTLWTRAYGGEGEDCGWAICELTEGFAIAGFTASEGAGGFDFWLLRTDAEGAVVWTRTYGGERDDRCWSLAVTDDGGFVLAGETSSSGAGERDGFLVRTDSQGEELWSRTYGGAKDDRCFSIAVADDGGLVLAGQTFSESAGDRDAWVVATDARGEPRWSKTFGGAESDVAHSVVATADGSFFVTGYTASSGTEGDDPWFLSLRPDGETEWETTASIAGQARTITGDQAPDGGYYAVGFAPMEGSDRSAALLIQLDEEGELDWWRTFFPRDGGESMAYSVRATADGGCVFTGHLKDGDDLDLLLVKTDGERP